MKHNIEEIIIKQKKKVGSGQEHNVYPSYKNPDSVFKTPKSSPPKIRMSWVYLFQEHPDIFPKVLQIKNNFVELEKLDTNKAIDEYTLLDSFLSDNEQLYDGDFAYTFSVIFRNNDYDKLDEIDEYFNILGDKVFQIYSKWRNLLVKFFDVMPYDYFSDLHVGQFGYSKDGKLKILDI